MGKYREILNQLAEWRTKPNPTYDEAIDLLLNTIAALDTRIADLEDERNTLTGKCEALTRAFGTYAAEHAIRRRKD